MLFDLKGKRRRAVQGTYLALAIILGAGLVLFGIGSSVNGGLGDLFKGGNGSNKANQTIQKKIDKAEKALATDPKNAPALEQVVKGHYQLATATSDPNTSEFTAASRKELLATASAWKRYEAAVPKPQPALASTVIQAYDGLGRLDQGKDSAKTAWAGAADAAEILANARPTAQNYLVLVQYASLAKQTRKADLAGKQAIKLAPKGQVKQVKQAIQQTKQQALQQSTGGQSGAQTPQPAPSG